MGKERPVSSSLTLSQPYTEHDDNATQYRVRPTSSGATIFTHLLVVESRGTKPKNWHLKLSNFVPMGTSHVVVAGLRLRVRLRGV